MVFPISRAWQSYHTVLGGACQRVLGRIYEVDAAAREVLSTPLGGVLFLIPVLVLIHENIVEAHFAYGAVLG